MRSDVLKFQVGASDLQERMGTDYVLISIIMPLASLLRQRVELCGREPRPSPQIEPNL